MLELIRCPDCGHDLGAVYPAFHSMRMELIKTEIEKKNIKVELGNSLALSTIKIPIMDVFDGLGIDKKRVCCRMHMSTSIDFSDAKNM